MSDAVAATSAADSTTATGSAAADPAALAAHARALLERLCRQPSVAAQGYGVAEMAALTESMLGEAGFSTRRLSIEGAPPIIYGEQRGRSPYTLLLYNHYDVQPAEPLDLWASAPFEPVERDGNLYARGASDNKGEIAARLAAIHALRDANGELPITVKWMIEGEEEIGSVHFGEIIAPHAGLLRADGCLWEGAGFDPDGRPELCLGYKGLLYVQLETRALSVDAHSGTAAILPSAAWRMVNALGTLRDPDGRVRIPGYYDAVRAPSAEQQAALADIPSHEDLWRASFGVERFLDGLTGTMLQERASFGPTCNIAGLQSGYTGDGVKTVLPATAMAKIDFRLVPDQDPHAIVAALRAHLDAGGYDDITLTVLGASGPVVTPFDDPFARRVIEVANAYAGPDKPAVLIPLAGGTLPLLDPLRRQVGVPGLSAPGNPVYWGSAAHSPNEHIRLADLAPAVAFNMHLLRALATP